MAGESQLIERDELPNSMKEFTIFRLPAPLRERGRKYYEPQVVSIGPYSHGKEHLRRMEKHKKLCLTKFVFRYGHNVIDKGHCLQVMKNLEARARNCYFERPRGLEGDKFANMLLVDGCFILHVMLEHYYNKGRNMPDEHLIRNDLLMLENQIPFFVLEKLVDLFHLSSNTRNKLPSLVDLAFQYLKPAKYEPKLGEHIIKEVRHSSESQHMLHLHYCFMLAEAYEIWSSWQCESRPLFHGYLTSLLVFLRMLIYFIPHLDLPFRIIGICIHNCFQWFKPPKRGRDRYTIPSATELQKVDVTLHKRKSPSCLWDIHFKNGVLHIPPIVVDESMKSLLMNLVAFEQCADLEVFHELTLKTYAGHEYRTDYKSTPESWKKFTAYALLMNSIVHTENDAMTLRQQGIIKNFSDTDEAVAEFFNHICDGVNHEMNHYFSEMFADVNKYCKPGWRKYKARLMQDYFRDPWSIVKVVAASLFVLLTIVDAVFALLKFLETSRSN